MYFEQCHFVTVYQWGGLKVPKEMRKHFFVCINTAKSPQILTFKRILLCRVALCVWLVSTLWKEERGGGQGGAVISGTDLLRSHLVAMCVRVRARAGVGGRGLWV